MNDSLGMVLNRSSKMVMMGMMLCLACSTASVDSPYKGSSSPSRKESSPGACLEGNRQETLAGFSFRLASAVLRDEKQNAVLSPLSAALSVGLSYPGAVGQTAAAFQEALGLTDWCQASVLSLLGRLFEEGQLEVPGVSLELANGIFASADLPIAPAFIEQNQRFSRSSIQRVRFGTQAAQETIDRWVGESTGGTIGELGADAYSADQALLLLNAVSFEGRWTIGFDKGLTRPGSFYVNEDRIVPATLMRANGTFSMVYGDDLQAVSLPYGDGRLAMTILLPYETDLAPALAALDEETFLSLLAKMTPQDGTVQMPRFSLTTELSLKAALSKLGLARAFSAEADFSALSPDAGLSLSDVKQKVRLTVSEDGTTAASATATEIKYGFFSVNHPFVFVIHDRETGKPLFIGQVKTPDGL